MTTLSLADVLWRMGAAVLAGILLGLERESHGRAAGLRTTLLTCSASAMAMLISEFLYTEASADGVTWRPDPARLAAGILTGIGFIGAGAIIKQGNSTRGVTTAAVLWFVTVLGLAFGSGNFLLGFLGLGVALFTLFILPYLEKFVQNDWYASVTVKLEGDSLTDDEIKKLIEISGARVKRMEMHHDLKNRQRTIHCDLKLKKGKLALISQRIVTALGESKGVYQVDWM